MTAGEMIRVLKKLPTDTPVVVRDLNWATEAIPVQGHADFIESGAVNAERVPVLYIESAGILGRKADGKEPANARQVLRLLRFLKREAAETEA